MSAALSLRTEDRDEFQSTLESCVRHSTVHPFEVAFTDLKWVPNHDRNRWFLVLGVARPVHDELNRLLEACNKACAQRGHSELYVEHGQRSKRRRVSRDTSVNGSDHTAAFHFSIAWNLEGLSFDIEQLSSSEKVTTVMEEHIKPMRVRFDSIKLKIGNVVTSIPLGSKAGESASILGSG